jgi:hypothetical protein
VDIQSSYGLFINGAFVDPISGGSRKTVNPALSGSINSIDMGPGFVIYAPVLKAGRTVASQRCYHAVRADSTNGMIPSIGHIHVPRAIDADSLRVIELCDVTWTVGHSWYSATS